MTNSTIKSFIKKTILIFLSFVLKKTEITKKNAQEYFEIAAQFGSLSIAKYLLPFVDPKANRSIALVWAADSGYVDMVKFLPPPCRMQAKEKAKLFAGPHQTTTWSA